MTFQEVGQVVELVVGYRLSPEEIAEGIDESIIKICNTVDEVMTFRNVNDRINNRSLTLPSKL